MRRAIVVSSANAYRMNIDLVEDALRVELGRYGFDPLVITREARAPRTDADDIWIFIGLGVPYQFRKCSGQRIVWNLHPTAPDRRYGKYALTNFKALRESYVNGWTTAVWDYNPQTTTWMQNEGIPAIFVPLGYHEVFDFTDKFSSNGDPRDVTFIGNVRGSRRYPVQVTGARNIRDVWGRARGRECVRRGIHLSLASYSQFRTCLTLRLIVLLASNGRAIVHEKTDWCPLRDGEHVVISSRDKIPKVVDAFRDHPEHQEWIGESVRDYVRTKYRFQNFLYAGLESIGAI